MIPEILAVPHAFDWQRYDPMHHSREQWKGARPKARAVCIHAVMSGQIDDWSVIRTKAR
jgi:hypothetical protein